MNLSAAVLVFAVSAAPAFAAEWAPAVNTEELSAIAAPAPSAPAKTSPRDGNNYSGAEELLIMEFGITAISMDIPEDEVIRQDRYYNNTFRFEQALRLVLNGILGNYSDPSSPLARTLGEMGAPGQPTKSQLKLASQKVLSLLNNPASQLSIVRPYKFNQPLKGETVEKNWIFFLSLNGRSYWAVADRSGAKAPYVYGLN